MTKYILWTAQGELYFNFNVALKMNIAFIR